MHKWELETIFNYNQEEATASIYTCDRSLITKLDKLAKKDPTIIEIRKDKYSKTYNLPKKYIKIQIPRQLSEKTKQELTERAKRNFGVNTK